MIDASSITCSQIPEPSRMNPGEGIPRYERISDPCDEPLFEALETQYHSSDRGLLMCRALAIAGLYGKKSISTQTTKMHFMHEKELLKRDKRSVGTMAICTRTTQSYPGTLDPC
jgi:hypothetical protein